MSKNLDGIVAKIRDVRAQKRPEIEKNLQKIDALLSALRDTQGRASTVAASVAASNPDLAMALQGVSFNDAKNKLLEAREACETALTRLCRASINIGVAAKAGQGKSQMLQMLTGLGSDQIPTGGGGACTAVRSIVHNSATKKAVVHYLTPAELLEKKVYPSYAPVGSTSFALGLSGKPTTLEGFLSSTLSTVDSADNLPTQGVNNWNDNVIPLHRALTAHPDLKRLLGNAPEEIPMEEVREYLVKDNDETKHNVVSFVELWTPFEVGLPEGLTVYDIPGLEDPTPGIREDMLESVKSDADVVFFLLKPPTNGERTLWGPADNDATDMLKSVYPLAEVKPQDWIQLILNEDKREGHRNGGSINLLLGKNADGSPSETLTSKIPKDFSPVVCDCGSKDAVREMVDANIDALVKQAGHIDDLRIHQADEKFRVALAEANALYNALRNASGDVIAQESGFNFNSAWVVFKDWLRRPFRCQVASPDHKSDPLSPFSELSKGILSKHFQTARAKFKSIYEANENAMVFPPELPVFSKRYIEHLMGGDDAENGINEAVRNQREAVLKFIRSELTECCNVLMDEYFKKVVSIGFDGNPALKLFGDENGKAVSRERIAGFLSSVRQSGNFPTIESAAEGLQTFCLTFEDTILPAIYSTGDLDDFDPDRSYEESMPETQDEDSDDASEADIRQIDMVKNHITKKIPASNPEERARYLFNWLRRKSEAIVSAMTSGSNESAAAAIAKYVAAAMKANYDAFVYRFIWGADCTSEWRCLADRNKAVFWKDEFDKASANSRLAKEWNDALASLASAL